MTKHPAGLDLIRQVRAQTGPRVIVSFSTGKDSIAAALACKPHFDELVPYFLYLVPGLSWVEESIAYYERELFGRKIIQLPHPSLFRWLNNFTFQPPGQAAVIAAARLPDFDYLDVFKWVCQAENLDPEKALVASGVRAADSPMRRLAFSTHGPISHNQRQFYPVWDWTKDRLISEIEQSGLKLPADYELFGRSFDGIDYRFLSVIKRKRPADWRTILDWFPLAEMEVWRYERA